MKEITFKYFAKHHLWLLLAVILIPVLGIGIYCGLFWRCIDESIVATIVMGVISYIGTVAWGLFIYYNSWSNEQLQKYRDKPRLRVGCVEKDNRLPLYTYEEVVNRSIQPNDRFADMFVYLKVRVINEGNHSIFSISPEDVLVQVGQEAGIPQNIKCFDCSNSSNVITFKEQHTCYVGVLKEVIGDKLDEASNYITYSFRFQDDLLNIYYCEVNVWIHKGVIRIPCSSKLYTDSEYQKIRNNRVTTIIHG